MKLKSFKKCLSLLLAILMVLSCVPVTVLAEEITPTSGSCGENATWTFDETAGTLTISGTGEMCDYAINNNPWRLLSNSITKIIINNGITSIGNYAFFTCGNFTEIIIPNSVTKIGNGAFFSCINLNKVTIPDSVTEIGEYVFYNCVNLTSITIPDSVTSIGSYAFYNCSQLRSITIPNSVVTIGNSVFVDCINLNQVTISEKISEINLNIFSGCMSLKQLNFLNDSLSIYDENLATKKDFAISAFCYDGETNTNYLTAYEYAKKYTKTFNSRGHVGEWTIVSEPSKTGNGIKSRNCSACGTAETEDIITYYCGENATWTFDEITGTLAINGTGSMNNFTSSNNIPWYSIRSKITNIVIEEGITTIGERAFYSCSALTSITIPDGITSIGSYTFYNCSSLENITIPNSVTDIGDYAFAVCNNLASIKMPNNVTTIGKYAFRNCTSLIEVNLSNIEIINTYTFADCTSLSKVVLPDTLKIIDSYAFYKCINLTNITIPNSVTAIGEWAFCDCASLKEITIPEGVSEIHDATFAGCTNLENLYLLNKSVSLKFASMTVEPTTTIHAYCSDIVPEHYLYRSAYAYTQMKRVSFVSLGHLGEWTIVSEPTETEYGTKTRTCTVCGKPEPATFSNIDLVTPESNELYIGYNKQIEFAAYPIVAIESFIYTSSDNSIIEVDENGNVTAIGAGDATVTITDTENESINFVVNFTVKELPTFDYTSITEIETEETADIIITPSVTTPYTVTISSSNEDVAIIENNILKAITPGTATITITVTFEDDIVVTKTFSINVLEKDVPEDIPENTPEDIPEEDIIEEETTVVTSIMAFVNAITDFFNSIINFFKILFR